MTEKGLLVVLSGFSGAGKGTLVKELLRRYPEEYALSVSATTRQPRAGETDGTDYFFVTKERFEELIRTNGLVEYACYVGNYYGTPREYVDRQRTLGKDVLLEIEIQGALKIRETYPEAILIFIAPPDADTLAARLSGRGTETSEQIAGRLHRAAEESRCMQDYDYLLINDDLDRTVERLHDLISVQHCRMELNRRTAEQLSADLSRYLS
ncbi:MAG: guanylate kinase [Stomatobaculum sp.]|nr:guanylate kinase [Stomatobaculum sp.]